MTVFPWVASGIFLMLFWVELFRAESWRRKWQEARQDYENADLRAGRHSSYANGLAVKVETMARLSRDGLERMKVLHRSISGQIESIQKDVNEMVAMAELGDNVARISGGQD